MPDQWDYSRVASVRYVTYRPGGFLIVHYGTPPFDPDRRFLQQCQWWWFPQDLHRPGHYPADELKRLGLSTYPEFIGDQPKLL